MGGAHGRLLLMRSCASLTYEADDSRVGNVDKEIQYDDQAQTMPMPLELGKEREAASHSALVRRGTEAIWPLLAAETNGRLLLMRAYASCMLEQTGGRR